MRKLIGTGGISSRLLRGTLLLSLVLSIPLMMSCGLMKPKPQPAVQVMPEARITPLKQGEPAPYDCVAITTSAYAKLLEKAKGRCQ